ncbi:MAG: hypothetical protein U0411_14010 [Thermodesulfovibrionales bacterium]
MSARVIGYSRQDVLVVPYGAEVEWSAILLATDGSAHSSGAAEKAVGLARAYGGTHRRLGGCPSGAVRRGSAALEELIRRRGAMRRRPPRRRKPRGGAPARLCGREKPIGC